MPKHTIAIHTLAALIAATSISGCASMPGTSWFSGASLPSPRATLASTSWTKKKDSDAAMIGPQMAEARNYEHSGQTEKARRIYEDLRKKYPENVAVAHRLGIVADTQRRHTEAEQLFLFALSKEPGNAAIMADLGYCYYLQGNLDKAEKYLAKAVEKEPNQARFRNNLGLVLGHLGRDAEALEQFRAAGSDADAYFNLAFVCASQDRIQDAKVCFQKALIADPTHTRAREALTAFQEYDALPPDMRESRMTQYADDGTKLIPHVEAQDSFVQQASGEVSLPSNRDASRTTRALQLRSRGGNRSLAGQTNEGNGQ